MASLNLVSGTGGFYWSIDGLGNPFNSTYYRGAALSSSWQEDGKTSLSNLLVFKGTTSSSSTSTSTPDYWRTANAGTYTFYGYVQAANGKYYYCGADTVVVYKPTPTTYDYYYAFQLYINNSWRKATSVQYESSTSSAGINKSLEQAIALLNVDLSDYEYVSATGVSGGCSFDNGYFTIPLGTSYSNYALGRIDYQSPPTYNYYLRYDANGGTGAPSDQSALNKTNTSWAFTVSSTKPTRTNYTFLGWDFSNTATSPTYPKGSSHTITLYNTNPDRTLYAVWSYTPTYNYSYRYNKNTTDTVTGMPSNQTFSTTESSYRDYLQENNPTRSGYTFNGWALNSSGTGMIYAPGDLGPTFTPDNNNITLYAIWDPHPVYTYSMMYGKNTNDNVSNMPSGESAESTAKSYSFTVSAKIPSRTGYNFEGWNLKSEGTGGWYTGGYSGPTLGFDNPSTTLYAIWSIKQYTVGATYYSGYSAAFSSISVSSTRVDHGGNAVFTANMATGYIFTGWYDSDGNLVSNDNPYTRTNITQAITLYARGQRNVFTATAHIGSGYEHMIGSVSANPTSVQYENTSVFTANLVTGYGFSGWYNSSGTLVSSDNPYTATITNNLTLYARGYLKSFVWDNNNNLDNRRPTANEWLRLITFVERKFGKTVSQEAKNSVVIGGTLSASLFNELTSDIGYASTVSRGTPISRAILYNLQNEANR